MSDFFYETLQKKDSECCRFIAQLNLTPHDLNDSKWFKLIQMTSVDLLDA